MRSHVRRMLGRGEAFPEKLDAVISHLDEAHATFVREAIFGGPSLYFHLTSLHAAQVGDFERFAEHVYACLSAWGMHRMGSGGAKMVEFHQFRNSLLAVREAAERLRDRQPETLGEKGWKDLEVVFRGIKCMASAATLVGNSKVMAHWLPNLVPPIDREYTLRLLYGANGNKPSIGIGPDKHWPLLRQILQGFFYPLIGNSTFVAETERWASDQNTRSPWDTSLLKTADNVVIGYVKMCAKSSALQAESL